jgi:hypothetical protein
MGIIVGGNNLTGTNFSTLGDTPSTPNVVTDGLVLWLDAGNNSSFINSSNYYDCGYGCQYYASNPGCTNCNSQWKDLSGNGNDGTLVNGTSINYGVNGGTMLFDGVNDRVSTGIYPNGVRTYMVWIKYNSATGTGGYQLTGTQQVNAYTYTGRQDSNGKIYTYAGSGGNGGESNYVLNISTWYYQGFTLESNGNVGIYVNGSLIETKTGNGLGGTPTNEFSIGCINQNHFVNGNIAAVHLYNKLLTPSEILQNFNNGRQRFGI